jgi:hypothetical protein
MSKSTTLADIAHAVMSFDARIAGLDAIATSAKMELEFRIQKSDIAYADRCRAQGFEPDPCDYEPVYG